MGPQPERRTRRRAGLLAMVAAAMLAGCSTEGRVEEGLEEALAKRLGPAQEYDVDVSGLRARRGEADHVRAEGLRIQPARGPVVDRLEVEMRNVRYDRERRRLVGAEDVRASVWLQPSDLEAYLENGQRVRNAAVTLAEPDRMRLRFRPELGLPIPLNVTADVEGTVQGRGSELHFVVAEASAGGVRIDGAMAERFTRVINPIVDLAELPLGLRVTSVRVDGGALRIDAEGSATEVVLGAAGR